MKKVAKWHKKKPEPKRFIRGKKKSYEDVEKWLDKWIAFQDESFFRNGIRALSSKWETVIAGGQYFE